MPRTRTYTNYGFVEVQWSKDGESVIVVVDGQHISGDQDQRVQVSVMHQFADATDLDHFIKQLKRAKRQAYSA